MPEDFRVPLDFLRGSPQPGGPYQRKPDVGERMGMWQKAYPRLVEQALAGWAGEQDKLTNVINTLDSLSPEELDAQERALKRQQVRANPAIVGQADALAGADAQWALGTTEPSNYDLILKAIADEMGPGEQSPRALPRAASVPRSRR